MPTAALTGQDTVYLKNNNLDRNLVDFGDGDVVTISYPNEVVTMKTGKNENTIYAKNAGGANADVEIRVLRGSDDDKALSSVKSVQGLDLSSFVTLSGQFIQRTGDGDGNISRTIYNLKGGIFKNNIDAKSNSDGDTEQGVAVYRLKFALATRSIT